MFCLLFLGFLPGLIFFVLGIRMQPLNGDLTRIGAYPERLYGWNQPQRIFAKRLYGTSVADQPDMLVIGDSFATAMANHQWQNHVVATTGLSVSTISSYDFTVDQVLADPAFKARPPKYLVLTLVERHFPRMLARQVGCDAHGFTQVPAQQGRQTPTLVTIPAIADAVEQMRSTEWTDLRDVPLGVAFKYVVREALYRLTGVQSTDAWQFQLTREDLFSNAVPDRLLVFRRDIEKTSQWRGTDSKEIDCRIRSLKRLVESNGYTQLIVMIPPDKLTAYAPWIHAADVKALSDLDDLARRHPSLIPSIDLALRQAIEVGHKDVYLPNNTHFGITGHLVAGQALVEFVGLKQVR